MMTDKSKCLSGVLKIECHLALFLLFELPHPSSRPFCSLSIRLLFILSNFHAIIYHHDFANPITSARNVFYPCSVMSCDSRLNSNFTFSMKNFLIVLLQRIVLLCVPIYVNNPCLPLCIVRSLGQNVTSFICPYLLCH